MAKAGIIEIDLAANTARFQSDMRKATASLNSNVAQMRRSTSNLEKSFGAVKNAFNGFLGVLAVNKIADVGGEILRTADRFNTLEARVKSAVGETGNFQRTFENLVASSNRTGASVEGTAGSFAKLNKTAKDLGRSEDDVIQFIETFQKMGTIAGSNTEEMKNSLHQLTQGIGGTVLQMNDLNSVLDQTPDVARAIADELGIPFKYFRKAVEDGLVTSEVVLNAIIGKTKEVDKEFAKMPDTLDRSMNSINNQFTVMIGKVNQTVGITKTLTKDLKDLSSWVRRNEKDITTLVTAFAKLIKMAYELVKAVSKISFKALQGASLLGQSDATRYIPKQYQPKGKAPVSGTSTFNKMIQPKYTLPYKKSALDDSNLVASLPSGDRFDIPLSQLMRGSVAGGAAAIPTPEVKAWLQKQIEKEKGGTSQAKGKKKPAGHNRKVATKNRYNDLKKQAESLTKSLRKPWEKEQDEVNKANDLLKKGLITRETYDRAVQAAHKKTSTAKKAVMTEEQKAQQKQREELVQDAKILTESMRNPWEVERDEIAKADQLLKNHLITQETYDRAVQEAGKNAKDAFRIDGLAEAVDQYLRKPAEEFFDSFETNLGELVNADGFREVQAVVEATLTPLEKYNQQMEYLKYLHDNAGLSLEAFSRAMKQAKDDLEASKQKGQEFSQAVGNIISQFGDDFFNQIISAFEGVKLSFSDLVASALKDLARLIFKLTVTIPLANAISSGIKGIGGKISGGGIGSFFKGILGFADGGSPPVGRASLVGERGPELFVPKVAGTIIPNHQLGNGGQAVQVTNVFQISTGVQQTVRAEIMQMMPQIEQRTTRAVQTATNRGGSMTKAVGRKG